MSMGKEMALRVRLDAYPCLISLRANKRARIVLLERRSAR